MAKYFTTQIPDTEWRDFVFNAHEAEYGYGGGELRMLRSDFVGIPLRLVSDRLPAKFSPKPVIRSYLHTSPRDVPDFKKTKYGVPSDNDTHDLFIVPKKLFSNSTPTDAQALEIVKALVGLIENMHEVKIPDEEGGGGYKLHGYRMTECCFFNTQINLGKIHKEPITTYEFGSRTTFRSKLSGNPFEFEPFDFIELYLNKSPFRSIEGEASFSRSGGLGQTFLKPILFLNARSGLSDSAAASLSAKISRDIKKSTIPSIKDYFEAIMDVMNDDGISFDREGL